MNIRRGQARSSDDSLRPVFDGESVSERVVGVIKTESDDAAYWTVYRSEIIKRALLEFL